MITPINPQGEQIRAQAILSSLTEYEKAVDLFGPVNPQDATAEPTAHATRNNRWSIMQIFKALKLNRRPIVHEPVQDPGYSPRQVTSGGQKSI